MTGHDLRPVEYSERPPLVGIYDSASGELLRQIETRRTGPGTWELVEPYVKGEGEILYFAIPGYEGPVQPVDTSGVSAIHSIHLHAPTGTAER